MQNDSQLTKQAKSISVVIPAFNEERRIATIIHTIYEQCPTENKLEIIVVDDASTDETAQRATSAGAIVASRLTSNDGGNPAASRNFGAAISHGELIIFLDADCIPYENWLNQLLFRCESNAVVSGSLALPKGLSFSARLDYYAGWYNFHPSRPAGEVMNAPPCNLAVNRDLFLSTEGFTEKHPVAYAHEELAWQAEVLQSGYTLYFEPAAIAYHFNRPGFRNLFRRNYRWGYSAIEAKSPSKNAQASWLYRHENLLIVTSPIFAVVSTAYITWRWMQAKKLEPLLCFPIIFLLRIAYTIGMVTGGRHWSHRLSNDISEHRPRWE